MFTRSEVAPIAQRMENAFDRLTDTIAEHGAITREQATQVAELYLSKKIRAAKLDVVGGQFTMTHGSFLDRDVIRRALATVEAAHV